MNEREGVGRKLGGVDRGGGVSSVIFCRKEPLAKRKNKQMEYFNKFCISTEIRSPNEFPFILFFFHKFTFS